MPDLTAVPVEPGGSPSNRKRTPSKNEDLLFDLGIDRLSVSFPVYAYQAEPEAWNRRSMASVGPDAETRTLMGSVKVGGVSVMVGMQERYVDGTMMQRTGKIEYNPSRIVDPDGCGLATLDETADSFDVVLAAAEQLVSPGDEPANFRVKRLDLARDFHGIEQPATLIRGLSCLHRPYARKNLIHADPAKNGAQTIVVGGKQSSVRLYDKAEETKTRANRAEPGTIRWEAENRKGWLSNYGAVERLRDLDPVRVAVLADNRWEWSQMGAEVAGDLARLVERVHESDLTAAERRGFLGWLVEQAAGMEGGSMSSATLAKYRRLQRRLGIVAPVDLAGTVTVLRRLDWATGTEVQRVA